MKHILITQESEEWGELLCDPAALPPDYEERFLVHPAKGESWPDFEARIGENFAALTAAGQACWIDGFRGCRVEALIDEPMRPELEKYAGPPITVEAFQVPSGRLCFANAECAADPESLVKDAWQGEIVDIPPGTYRLTLWKMIYPPRLVEDLVAARLSPVEEVLLTTMRKSVVVALIALLLLLISFLAASFFRTRGLWAEFVLPIGLLLIALPFGLGCTSPVRRVLAYSRQIRDEYPDVVAMLDLRVAPDKPGRQPADYRLSNRGR